MKSDKEEPKKPESKDVHNAKLEAEMEERNVDAILNGIKNAGKSSK